MRAFLEAVREWLLPCLLAAVLPPSSFGAVPCSRTFLDLVERVHRPGFVWTAGLPNSGQTLTAAIDSSVAYIMQGDSRPVPPVDPVKHLLNIQLIDAFFTEAVKGYSEPIQDKVRAIYEDLDSYRYTRGLYAQSQFFANWHLRAQEDGKLDFWVEFDESLRNARLIQQIFMIHECAVHMGQMMQRFEQVGLEQIGQEHQTKDLYLFTEMSAAAAEKALLSVVDFSAIEADARLIPDPKMRLAVLFQMRVVMAMKPRDYVGLAHRFEPVPPTENQIRAFLVR